MRASRRTLGAAAAALAVAASTVGFIPTAGAAARPATTSIKGVSVYGAASPEAISANNTKTAQLTVTVKKYGKPYAGVVVTLNMADLKYEAQQQHVCSVVFYESLLARFPYGRIGKTNTKGQVTIAGGYRASNVKPGSFCLVIGGILGSLGPNIVPSGTGTVKQRVPVGEGFTMVVCQTNPLYANDPNAISQQANQTSVHVSGPHDPFALTVLDDGTPVSADPTIFYLEVHSTWQSCGSPLPIYPPGAATDVNGHATINYVPSTTVGTCQVTAQEADYGAISNMVKITQTTP